MKFTLLSNDVGPNQYSCFADIEAPDLETAKKIAKRKKFAHEKALAIPLDKVRELHDGMTGKIKPGVFETYGVPAAC